MSKIRIGEYSRGKGACQLAQKIYHFIYLKIKNILKNESINNKDKLHK